MNDILFKVRLKRTHFLNGIRKTPGTVIRLSQKSAEWLVEKGVATILPNKPQNKGK